MGANSTADRPVPKKESLGNRSNLDSKDSNRYVYKEVRIQIETVSQEWRKGIEILRTAAALTVLTLFNIDIIM